MSQWHRIRMEDERAAGVFVPRLQEAAVRIVGLGLFSYGQSLWRRRDGDDGDNSVVELFLAPGTFDLLPAFLAGCRVERCEQPAQDGLELLAGDEKNCRQWWR